MKREVEDRKWGEWKYDNTNHHIITWQPIGISFVEGGNHSITSGVLKGKGKLKSKYLLNLSKIYQKVFCDGEYYYFLENGRKLKLSKVGNINFAIIFEIGRLL